jgi:hypothetical protein
MNEAINATEATPGTKERAIFVLKSLIELIENDHVRVGDISGLTADDILDLAESEAVKAVEGSQALKDS